jgi:hypothetical protein
MQLTQELYTPLGLGGHELCHPIHSDDFERINVEINGTPRQLTWKPLAMRLIHEDQGQQLVTSDSPWIGDHALIFRARVVDALGPMLRQYGELLPLACSEADLVVYNATRVIAALDEEASSILRFSGGRIMMIQRYVFRGDLVGDTDVFKLPNLRVSPTFVSRHFVDHWRAAGLDGLDFRRV